MVIFAIAFAGSSRIEPNQPDPRIEQLERTVDHRDNQLHRMRQLFTYCRTSVNWQDDRCSNPSSTAPQSIVVTDPTNTTRYVRDDDDDDEGSTTTVVVRPGATTGPKATAAPKPNPTSQPTDPVTETVKEVQEIVEDVTENLPPIPDVVGSND
jgi:hypothetical protein